MKPSEKAIMAGMELLNVAYRECWATSTMFVDRILFEAYAIDVDPLIEQLETWARFARKQLSEKDWEIERLKSRMGEMVADTLALQDGSLYNEQKQRIATLKAEVERFKSENYLMASHQGIDHLLKRIATLEAENEQLKEELQFERREK